MPSACPALKASSAASNGAQVAGLSVAALLLGLVAQYGTLVDFVVPFLARRVSIFQITQTSEWRRAAVRRAG